MLIIYSASKASFPKGPLNSPNPPIHHIGWGDDLTPCLRKSHRNFRQSFNGALDIDLGTLKEAAVPMTRPGAETHVTCHQETGERLPYPYDGWDHWGPLRVFCCTTHLVLITIN